MKVLFDDLRYGLRMLLRNPGFALVAVITLALGIGANSAIFSVVDSVLLRPLPYPEPDRLAQVWERRPKLNRERNVVSPADFLDWRAGNRSFERMAAYVPIGFNVTGREEPARLTGLATTPDLFPLLRAQARLGRTFLTEEEGVGRDQVVILSDGLWRRRFGSAPDVIGKTINLNGKEHVVVGVMPAAFSFPDPDTELWVPLAFAPAEAGNRGLHYLRVIARLGPAATLEQARAEMEALATRLEQAYPQVNTGHGVNVFLLHEEIVGSAKPALLVLLGAVGFVLLIACANVANLLLARMTDRQKEIAIRTAMGAGRSRIMRQVLTESALLGTMGGALGLLLALWSTDLLVKVSSGSLPRSTEIHTDLRVLAFTLALSLLTGLLFGLIPSLQVSRLDLNRSLKETGASIGRGGRNRALGFFVIAEVALSLVLLIGAGLSARSFTRLLEVSPGFNPEGVLTMNANLAGAAYKENHRRVAFYKEALQRISGLPRVESTATVLNLPFVDFGSRYFRIENRPPQPQGQGLNANSNIVSPGYFRTMGIPLREGRDFTDADDGGSIPVVIVNETMSRRFWPDEDPVGRRLAVGDEPWRTIVGVVGDVKSRGLGEETQPEMYYPQFQSAFPAATLVIRTTGDPLLIAPSARAAIHAIDPDIPLFGSRSLQQVLADSVSTYRFNMSLLGIFAGVAIALAMVGIYGVISYSVSRRTHEIGIRMALGAYRRDVLLLVIRQGLALSSIGIVVGIAGAFALTRVMSGLLFGVSAVDPLTFTIMPLLLMSTALLGCYLPARRATRVDPMIALRDE